MFSSFNSDRAVVFWPYTKKLRPGRAVEHKFRPAQSPTRWPRFRLIRIVYISLFLNVSFVSMGFAQRVYEGTYLDRCCDHDYFKLRLEKERVFDLIVRSEDRLDSFHGKWLNHGDSIFCITDHSTWVKTEIRQLSLSRGNDIKIFATDTLGRIIPIELGPYIDNSKFTDTLQVNLKSLENNLEIFTRKYGKAQISFDGIKPGVLNIKMREILMVFKGNQVDSNTVFLDLGYISKLKRQ